MNQVIIDSVLGNLKRARKGIEKLQYGRIPSDSKAETKAELEKAIEAVDKAAYIVRKIG